MGIQGFHFKLDCIRSFIFETAAKYLQHFY